MRPFLHPPYKCCHGYKYLAHHRDDAAYAEFSGQSDIDDKIVRSLFDTGVRNLKEFLIAATRTLAVRTDKRLAIFAHTDRCLESLLTACHDCRVFPRTGLGLDTPICIKESLCVYTDIVIKYFINVLNRSSLVVNLFLHFFFVK